jgi:hypothetical protein
MYLVAYISAVSSRTTCPTTSSGHHSQTFLSIIFDCFHFIWKLPICFKITHLNAILSYEILISGFRRDGDVICGLLGNYTYPISHPATVQHLWPCIQTLHPPTHPIGHYHIARLPTPPCCQVSLSQAFFPSRNLDPWSWDRHVVPKRR